MLDIFPVLCSHIYDNGVKRYLRSTRDGSINGPILKAGRRKVWHCLFSSTCPRPHQPLKGSWKEQPSEQALISPDREVVSSPWQEMGKSPYAACGPLPGSVLT